MQVSEIIRTSVCKCEFCVRTILYEYLRGDEMSRRMNMATIDLDDPNSEDLV